MRPTQLPHTRHKIADPVAVVVLKAAAELVDKGWTQEGAATDPHGNVLDPTDPRATRFCLWGAIERAAHDYDGDTAIAYAAAYNQLPTYPWGLATWNDDEGRTATQVSAHLRKAANSPPPEPDWRRDQRRKYAVPEFAND